jgi:hypothetical protein
MNKVFCTYVSELTVLIVVIIYAVDVIIIIVHVDVVLILL